MQKLTVILMLSTLLACRGGQATQNQTMTQSSDHSVQPAAQTDGSKAVSTDTATFGAGCFWCVEAIFQQMKGVDTVISGYMGGGIANPTYQEVCSGLTGHVEVVQIQYDPSVVAFERLLEVFWKTHDPTTPNRQGADVGTQYRSVVFYHSDAQRAAAQRIMEALNASGAFDAPIVTGIEPAVAFYKAESYHQNYFRENGEQPYCRAVVRPKVEKFEKLFQELLKGRE